MPLIIFSTGFHLWATISLACNADIWKRADVHTNRTNRILIPETHTWGFLSWLFTSPPPQQPKIPCVSYTNYTPWGVFSISITQLTKCRVNAPHSLKKPHCHWLACITKCLHLPPTQPHSNNWPSQWVVRDLKCPNCRNRICPNQSLRTTEMEGSTQPWWRLSLYQISHEGASFLPHLLHPPEALGTTASPPLFKSNFQS